MIKVTKVNSECFFLNENYIEAIEANSERDTTIKIYEGTTYIVSESPHEILQLILDWQNHANRITPENTKP